MKKEKWNINLSKVMCDVESLNEEINKVEHYVEPFRMENEPGFSPPCIVYGFGGHIVGEDLEDMKESILFYIKELKNSIGIIDKVLLAESYGKEMKQMVNDIDDTPVSVNG